MSGNKRIVRLYVCGHPGLTFAIGAQNPYHPGVITDISVDFEDVRVNGNGGCTAEQMVYRVTLDTGERITLNAENPLLVVYEMPK